MVKCPHCGEELHRLCVSRNMTLEQAGPGEKWIEKNVFASDISCALCDGTLFRETLEQLGGDLSDWQ